MATAPARCENCTLFTAAHNTTRDKHVAAGKYDPVCYECPGCHGTACTGKQLSSHINSCATVGQLTRNRPQDTQINTVSSKIYSNNPLWDDERQEQGIVLHNLPPIVEDAFRIAYRIPQNVDYTALSAWKRSQFKLPAVGRGNKSFEEETAEDTVDDAGDAINDTAEALDCDEEADPLGGVVTLFPTYGSPHHPPGPSMQPPSQAMPQSLVGPCQHIASSSIYDDGMATISTPANSTSNDHSAGMALLTSTSTPATFPGSTTEAATSGPCDTTPAITPTCLESRLSPPHSPATSHPIAGTLFSAPAQSLSLARALETAARAHEETTAGSGNVVLNRSDSPKTIAFIRELEATRDPERPGSPVEISEQQKEDLRARLEAMMRDTAGSGEDD